jgi:hypothetical protein
VISLRQIGHTVDQVSIESLSGIYSLFFLDHLLSFFVVLF